MAQSEHLYQAQVVLPVPVETISCHAEGTQKRVADKRAIICFDAGTRL